MRQELDFNAGDILLAVTSLSFDIAGLELYLPLAIGATTMIASREVAADGYQLVEALRQSCATVMQATPSTWRMLAESGWQGDHGLRMLCGGEELPRDLATQMLGWQGSVYNLYGPTETTIWSTVTRVTSGAGSVSLGHPISNTQCYVLDSNLDLAPIGVSGELYIAGEGLARGYLKRSDLTARSFVANPFSKQPGARMYWTGDLAQWQEDGTLEFLGRSDEQVKIRGFRVEPGEIEAALRRHERVQDAVVTVSGKGDEKRLLGYVIRQQRETGQAQAQASHIREWQELWESIYAQGEDVPGDFNIAGWKSSYTNEPIAAEEMRIWVEETVKRLRVLEPRRILEIGCGTGLLLTRLAGACENYVGVDFSAEVLNQIESYLSTRGDLKHVELRQGAAHELLFMCDDSVDLVIVNSVVQYFPDVDYLLEVLAEAIRVTRWGGHIFVGDVRALPLLDAYHTSVQMYKAAGEMAVVELKQRVRQGQQKEEELVVDARLFEELGRRWEKVGRVETWLKAGAYDNELSRFRYDVVMRMGKKEVVMAPKRWVRWDEDGQWREVVEQALAEEPGISVGVSGIRDRRVASAVEAVRMLQSGAHQVKDVAQLQAICAEKLGEDPDAVMGLAERLGVKFCWQGFDAGGLYDGVFNPRWGEVEKSEEAPRAYYRRYGNAPRQSSEDRELGRVLQDYLRRILPNYMVPSAIIVLERMPLTVNGKLDRRALPSPDRIRMETEKDYLGPRTSLERLLVDIWSDVLQVEQIGINNNFFELGGDSILSIKVTARANRAGVHIKPAQLFRDQTIAELAAEISRADERWSEQMEEIDEVPLTPIQRWFFERNSADPHSFVQAALMDTPSHLNPSLVKQIIEHLLLRHDALRLRFIRDSVGMWKQKIAAPDSMVPFSFHDLSGSANADQLAVIRSASSKIQTKLNFQDGPLICFVFFELGDKMGGRLLIAVHHLAVDIMSWRILLEDFQTLYEQLRRGGAINLPAKTATFKQWAHQLARFAQSENLLKERSYWLAGTRKHVSRVPLDNEEGSNTEESARTFSTRLSEEETQSLFQVTAKAYRTQVSDVLLTALVLAFRKWSGEENVLIDIEGHGREDVIEDLNVKRTVGWLTAIFPIKLDISGAVGPIEALKKVKEQIRSVPSGGVGYGILKYLAEDQKLVSELRSLPQAKIGFNYVGQNGNLSSNREVVKPAQEPLARMTGGQCERPYALMITGELVEGRLTVN